MIVFTIKWEIHQNIWRNFFKHNRAYIVHFPVNKDIIGLILIKIPEYHFLSRNIRSVEFFIKMKELEVAEEENMGGEDTDILDRILRALLSLGAEVDYNHEPPTKQGGE